MVDRTDDFLQEFEKAYCPLLDPALFNAIVSDFDLADRESVKQLRDTLDALKISAEEQQDLPFDPSGTGGLGVPDTLDMDGLASEHSTSRNDMSGESRETDITSLQSDFSSRGADPDDTKKLGQARQLSSHSSAAYTIRPDGSLTLTGMTVEEKIAYLGEMFPSVTEYTVKHTLMKYDYDVDRAMDILLNEAFFTEQGPVDDDTKILIPKGIDGFVEGTSNGNGKRRGKSKKLKVKPVTGLINSNSPAAFPQLEFSTVNKWDAGKKDMEFICSRTSPILKKEAVASAYHANSTSLAATIQFLAMSQAPKDASIASDDPVTVAQVAELTQEFPTIPCTTLEGLLKITRNSVSAANELATAMLVRPSAPQLSDIIHFNAPSPVIDQSDHALKSQGSPRVISHYNTAHSTASAHYLAGADAFAKASTAYRRGKSDRLMGGAAAYYSAVGRDHLEKAKRETSAGADAMVDTQSTADVLDLHGITVQDAVRIASARVSQWWESLGEAKYIPSSAASRPSYKIVTGAGRHSRDGSSRLGPAVLKMLVREGWRVEVGSGVLSVTGMVRRR